MQFFSSVAGFFYYFFCSFLSSNLFMPQISYMPKQNTAIHMRQCTNILYHDWKMKINTCLPDNTPKIPKKHFLLFDFTGDWNHCQMRRCCSSMGGLITSPCSRTVASMERCAGFHVCQVVYFSVKLLFRWEQYSCTSVVSSSVYSPAGIKFRIKSASVLGHLKCLALLGFTIT